jgi:hypothetical protein
MHLAPETDSAWQRHGVRTKTHIRQNKIAVETIGFEQVT